MLKTVKYNKRKEIKKEDVILFKTFLLKALSDETRQSIIVLLGQRHSLRVSDIASYFHLSRPTISHHLSTLKNAKVVYAFKRGKEIYYELRLSYIKKALKNLTLMTYSIQKHRKHDLKNNSQIILKEAV